MPSEFQLNRKPQDAGGSDDSKTENFSSLSVGRIQVSLLTPQGCTTDIDIGFALALLTMLPSPPQPLVEARPQA